MGEYSKKLYVLRNGVTTGIKLYTDKSEVGEHALCLKDGNTTLYAKVGDTGDANASPLRVNIGGMTYAVHKEALPPIGKSLDEYTWAEISQISLAGLGETYFNIGDRKAVTLNGKIGDYFTLSNRTLYVFILDFNHVDGWGAAKNIFWGCFKTSNGSNVCLVDSCYQAGSSNKKCFSMNHWGNVNYGGWAGCDMRYDILGATSPPPSDYGRTHTTSCEGYDATPETLSNPVPDTFLAALPSDLRNVIRLRTHFVDRRGNKSNADENVIAYTDAVSLLTEYEVFGTRYYANQYEQDLQAQMRYYAEGKSKVKKNQSNTDAVTWWTASPNYASTAYFSAVYTDGNVVGSNGADFSRGLAPVFIT